MELLSTQICQYYEYSKYDDDDYVYRDAEQGLPISLSKKYQVNQVNHKVGKKHQRQTAYNNPNVHIKIFIPCIYLVKHAEI